MNDIKEFIQNGISDAYFQNLYLKKPDIDLQFKITEYICTVNVAQQLLKWIETKEGQNHSIHVEYDADDFKRKAFLPIKWEITSNDILTGRRLVRRSEHKTIREGRIDIAVMRKKAFGEVGLDLRSIVGVEVKAINPDINLVVADILRLSDALSATDTISPNSIQEGYITFCIRLDTPAELYDGNNFDQKCGEYKIELEQIVKDVLTGTFEVANTVTVWEILKRTVAEYVEHIPEDERDARDIADNTGAVIGVLIKLERV